MMYSKRINYFLCCCLLCVIGTNYYGQEQAPKRQSFERMFYPLPYKSLEKGILDTSRKHMLYTNIIANLTTPYFDIMNELPPEDRAELSRMIPMDESRIDKRIMAEYVMSKFAQNSKRFSAMMTMWASKKQSLNRIVTLGK